MWFSLKWLLSCWRERQKSYHRWKPYLLWGRLVLTKPSNEKRFRLICVAQNPGLWKLFGSAENKGLKIGFWLFMTSLMEQLDKLQSGKKRFTSAKTAVLAFTAFEVSAQEGKRILYCRAFLCFLRISLITISWIGSIALFVRHTAIQTHAHLSSENSLHERPACLIQL